MHAAALARAQNRDHARRGLLAEISRKISANQEAVGLGDFAGRIVVRIDVVELVAQILLDHRLHVLGDVNEPLLDRARISPNPLANQLLEFVAEMHECSKTLAERHWIDEGEAHLRRRDRNQDSTDQRLHRVQRLQPGLR